MANSTGEVPMNVLLSFLRQRIFSSHFSETSHYFLNKGGFSELIK